MNLLTDEELAQLSELDRAIYGTLLRTIERHSTAAFLADEYSGFFLRGIDTLEDDPYVVEFRLRFRPEGWPGLDGNFNPCPHGIHFYFYTSIGIRPRSGWSTIWPMLLTDYSSESAFLQASSEFVSDWLNGETQVEIATANGVPYRWTIRRRGRQLWSHRSFLYPFWGRKALVIRACGGQEQENGQENVSA